MKFTGKFKVKVVKSKKTDGGCAYPKITRGDDNLASSVRVDGGDSMVCWTMQQWDFTLGQPRKGDRITFELPSSKMEAEILSVEETMETRWGIVQEYWLLQVKGWIDGAYNSIQGGNPVASVLIPLEAEVLTSTSSQKVRFGDYVAERIKKQAGSEDLAVLRERFTSLREHFHGAEEMVYKQILGA